MDEELHSKHPNPCGWVLSHKPIFMSNDKNLKKSWFFLRDWEFFVYVLSFENPKKTNVFKEVLLNNERFHFN